MRAAPREFAELLSPAGRAILRSRHRKLTRARPFVALNDLLNRERSLTLLKAMNATLFPTLKPMTDAIPPWTIDGMTQNYGELLPKTVRVMTSTLESPRSRSWKCAEALGLIDMLQSPSIHEFAEKLSGHRLSSDWGMQALCYRTGDYSGPHNDHHPEDAEAKAGYVDLHLTFCNDAVDHQWLVYEKRGHLSEMTDINTLGGVTCYRLPFWHYTTPLMAKAGQGARARRWVLLSTFIDAGAPG